MAEKKDRIQSELDKKYLKLEKQFISSSDKIEKLEKDFKASTIKKASELNKQKQDLVKSEKEMLAKKTTQTKDEVNKFNEEVKDKKELVKKATLEAKEDLEKSELKLAKEEGKINKTLESIQAKFEKEKKDLVKASESFVIKSEKAISDEESKNSDKLVALASKLDDHTEKHNKKVESIKDKLAKAIEKLESKCDKESKKLEKEILEEEKSTQKRIDDLTPILNEKIQKYTDELKAFEEVYNEKCEVINTTLKEKNDRHQKFLDKALAENDPRSQKLHKKEMMDLSKNATQELKILTSDFDKNKAAIDVKIKELRTLNIQDIKNLNVILAKFVEEKKFMINMASSEKTLELEKANSTLEQSLKDEDDKNDKYLFGVKEQQAVLAKDLELFIAKEKSNQAQNKIELANDELALAQENVVDIAKQQNEKELAILASELSKAKILEKKDIAIAKAENQSSVASAKIEQDKKVIELEKTKELYEFDFNLQSDVNKNNVAYQNLQTDFSQKRFEALNDYETMEIENRLKLNLELIDKELKFAYDDQAVLMAKIESHFEEEKAVFDKEIKKVAGDLLKEKAKLEKAENVEIDEIKQKIEDLDDKADKKEIKLLTKDIQVKEMSLNQKLLGLEKDIALKTSLFENGILEAKLRKEEAQDDTKNLLEQIVENLNKVKESVKANSENELNSLKEKMSTVKAVVVKYNGYSKDRTDLQEKQNKDYKEFRTENANVEIANVKQEFEAEKFKLSEALDLKLAEIANALRSSEAEVDKQIQQSNSLLENVTVEAERAKLNKKQESDKELENNNQAYRKEVKESEDKLVSIKSSIAKDLQVKDNAYKADISALEKRIVEANKMFEGAKKNFAKVQSDNASKKVAEINSQATLDIKSL